MNYDPKRSRGLEREDLDSLEERDIGHYHLRFRYQLNLHVFKIPGLIHYTGLMFSPPPSEIL
jgi:hypothetical protein